MSFERMEEERGLATRFRGCMEEECFEFVSETLVLDECKKGRGDSSCETSAKMFEH